MYKKNILIYNKWSSDSTSALINKKADVLKQISIYCESVKKKNTVDAKDQLHILKVMMMNQFPRECNCESYTKSSELKWDSTNWGCDLREMLYDPYDNVMEYPTNKGVANRVINYFAEIHGGVVGSMSKILTDIDDTIYQNHQKGVAGSDSTYIKKKPYPYIGSFYEKFREKFCGTEITNRFPNENYAGILSATPGVLKSGKLSNKVYARLLGENFPFLHGFTYGRHGGVELFKARSTPEKVVCALAVLSGLGAAALSFIGSGVSGGGPSSSPSSSPTPSVAAASPGSPGDEDDEDDEDEFHEAVCEIMDETEAKEIIKEYDIDVNSKEAHPYETGAFDVIQKEIRFEMRSDYRAMGENKFKRFQQYISIFPEYKITFIGDNGQGDVYAGYRMIHEYPDNIAYVAIHTIIPSTDAIVNHVSGGKVFPVRTPAFLEKTKGKMIPFGAYNDPALLNAVIGSDVTLPTYDFGDGMDKATYEENVVAADTLAEGSGATGATSGAGRRRTRQFVRKSSKRRTRRTTKRGSGGRRKRRKTTKRGTSGRRKRRKTTKRRRSRR